MNVNITEFLPFLSILYQKMLLTVKESANDFPFTIFCLMKFSISLTPIIEVFLCIFLMTKVGFFGHFLDLVGKYFLKLFTVIFISVGIDRCHRLKYALIYTLSTHMLFHLDGVY